MRLIKSFAFAFVLTFSALLVNAQAQTPRVNTVNVTTESDKVHISAEGDVAEMRIEVVSEAGDVVFESGAISGNTLNWNMQDAQGQRVAAGTYLLTVTFRMATGKLRKRVEQVTVEDVEQAKPALAPNAVQATVMTSGTTTAGKIAKFATPSTITNSVLTESAAKVGVGITPSATSGKLIVAGQIQTTGAGAGIKFADNSVQTKAGLPTVSHNTTLSGAGTSASPLTIAPLGVGNGQLATGAVTGAKIAVPLALSGSDSNPILSVSNAGSGAAISTTGAINTNRQYNIGGDRVLSIPGMNNTFVGVRTGESNTMGKNNAFFGTDAGLANTMGNANTFLGRLAGTSNTTGNNNTFVGAFAGLSNEGGGLNSFFGANAGESNTGCCNAFFGWSAGSNNTTGQGNSFFGAASGKGNESGEDNSFFGTDAGFNNTAGIQNSFFGAGAGQSNTIANNNSFFGWLAGTNNTEGVGNTFVGWSTGASNTTENNNTFIGVSANGAAGITNATAIGANASVSQSNSVVLGSTNVSVGVGNSAPKAKLHVTGGKIYVEANGQGIILKSPDGTCYEVTVADGGALGTATITCPM